MYAHLLKVVVSGPVWSEIVSVCGFVWTDGLVLSGLVWSGIFNERSHLQSLLGRLLLNDNGRDPKG